MHRCRSALATTALVAAVLGLTASGAAGQAPGTPAQGASAATTPQTESALLVEMNRVRADHGRDPLRSVGTLRRPARDQSRYLLPLGILDHDSADGSPFWTRLVAAGFPRERRMAENLALVNGCGPDAARVTVQLWLASPGHRANLLSPKYHWVGAGVASDGDCSTSIVTADYGS